MREPETEGNRPAGRLLIVDDEEFIRNSFQLYFETLDFKVSTADGGEAALRIFREIVPEIDVVLLDLVMPGMHGIEILQRLKELDPNVEVVIATGCGNMHTAIQALRLGAFDYITKPIVNFEEDLLKVVREAIESRRARGSRRVQGDEGQSERRTDRGAGGSSEFMVALEDLASKTRGVGGAEARFAALGAVLERHLEAEAAIAFEQHPDDRLRCLGQWGEFRVAERQGDTEFSLLQAAAIVATLADERRWQPVHPEVSAFAGCRPSGDAPPVEALLIPMDPPASEGRDVSSHLLVLRRARRSQPRPFLVPCLLSLVASSLLYHARDSGTGDAEREETTTDLARA